MSDGTLSPLEKERHVVGMALRDTAFLEYLHAQMLATDWLNLTHRAIVESAHAAYTLVGRLPEPADTIIAGERIGHGPALERSGGTSTVEGLKAATVSVEFGRQFVTDLHLLADQRALNDAGNYIADLLKKNEPDPIGVATQHLLGLGTRRHPGQWSSAGDVVNDILQGISGELPLDASLSFSRIDALDGPIIGWKPGWMVTLATISHVGKTVLSLNAASRFSRHNNAAILYLAYEQEKRELGRMLLSMWTGPHVPWLLREAPPAQRVVVSPTRIQLLELSAAERKKAVSAARGYGYSFHDGEATARERLELANAAGHVKRMNFTFDTARQDIAQVRANVRRFARMHPDVPLWVFLDYAQIARAENAGRGRTEELTFLSRQIKISAGTDLDGRGSWWANVQFNREADKALITANPDDLPLDIYNQYMLNGTGAFEQDSDVLMFAHRADRHPKRTAAARGKVWSKTDIGFGKNRPTGMIVNTSCWMNMVNLSVVNEHYPVVQETPA
jgi:replicative DNA helicase